jgi:hypothetical protein
MLVNFFLNFTYSLSIEKQDMESSSVNRSALLISKHFIEMREEKMKLWIIRTTRIEGI